MSAEADDVPCGSCWLTLVPVSWLWTLNSWCFSAYEYSWTFSSVQSSSIAAGKSHISSQNSEYLDAHNNKSYPEVEPAQLWWKLQTDPFFANSCLKAEHLVPFQDGLLLSQQLSALCLPLLFEYIVDGIRVVNSDKESYHCSNYKSALELLAAEKMLKINSSGCQRVWFLRWQSLLIVFMC